jgi:hypothetical protein
MTTNLCCLVKTFCVCPTCHFKLCYDCFSTLKGDWAGISNPPLWDRMPDGRIALICRECKKPQYWLNSDLVPFS